MRNRVARCWACINHPPVSPSPSKEGVKVGPTPSVEGASRSEGVGFDYCGITHRVCRSGSSVEPDNTNGSKSNLRHKEASGVRLKCGPSLKQGLKNPGHHGG